LLSAPEAVTRAVCVGVKGRGYAMVTGLQGGEGEEEEEEGGKKEEEEGEEGE